MSSDGRAPLRDLMVVAVKMAVENAWSFLECASVWEGSADGEWMNLGEEVDDLQDELRLLVGLGLARVDPECPVRVLRVDGVDLDALLLWVLGASSPLEADDAVRG